MTPGPSAPELASPGTSGGAGASPQPADLEQQALLLIQQGRHQQAEAIYRHLVEAGSTNPMVFSNLAALCGMAGRFDALIEWLERALEIQPDYPEALNNLGVAYKKQGRLDAAIAALSRAIQLQGDYHDAHSNLGICLNEMGDLEGAAASLRRAIMLRPDFSEAHYNLGIVLKEQADLEGAIASYRRALRHRPDFVDALGNLSMTLLLAGQYRQGWRDYDCRFRLSRGQHALAATPRCPRWDGSPLQPGSHLLLVSEQGLGDTLQFMRYVIPLRRQGLDVSLCAQPKLHRLIQESGLHPDPLSPDQAGRVDAGHWIPLLSLPGHLDVRPDHPIVTDPYIRTTPELRDRWQRLLAAESAPIVGLNWQGNPQHETANSVGRSLPLEAFAPIAATGDVRLLSLQKGPGSEQLQACSFRDRFVSCQEQVDGAWDFLETAAIIANCDLVITSDTSVAHLAGGMGRPTWLLLKSVPEWRWGLEGETSFWYPSMRLFRQRERGNWSELLARVAAELQAQLASGSLTRWRQPAAERLAPSSARTTPIQVPISLGELIDKITILQIKSRHLQGSALDNVQLELQALETTLEDQRLAIDPTLMQQLQQVNQELWRIEDAIREQERQGLFDDVFIQLARSVYHQNDRRAAIKKQINIRYGSAFVEEKSYQAY